MASAAATAADAQPSGATGWNACRAAAVTLGSSPVLRFGVPGAMGVMYDEPHEVLLVVAEQKVRGSSTVLNDEQSYLDFIFQWHTPAQLCRPLECIVKALRPHSFCLFCIWMHALTVEPTNGLHSASFERKAWGE